MQIFIEIITIIWQTVWGMLNGIATVVWDNLPIILEIKKMMGYFTPAGIIALWLGVPTFVVTLIIILFKRIRKQMH